MTWTVSLWTSWLFSGRKSWTVMLSSDDHFAIRRPILLPSPGLASFVYGVLCAYVLSRLPLAQLLKPVSTTAPPSSCLTPSTAKCGANSSRSFLSSRWPRPWQ